MKTKFAANCGILALPFLAVLAIELFLVPVNFFNFRIWEALQVKTLVRILPGPFYPDQTISMLEVGDLGHGTKHEIKRWSNWITDRFGFRAKNTTTHRRVVIIGDSNIAGANVSQDQMLGEVLAANMRTEVYSFAPTYIDDFLLQRYLSPDVVVFAVAERSLHSLTHPSRGIKFTAKQLIYSSGEFLRKIPGMTQILVYADRLTKLSALNFVKSKIFGNRLLGARDCAQESGTMLFFQGRKALEETSGISAAQKKGIVSTVCEYRRLFASRGIRFIFMPIPNKETIYHRELDWPSRSGYLDDVIRLLDSAKVETISLQQRLENAQAATDTLLYSLDDTHWAPPGIRIAAREVQNRIEETIPY